MLAIRMQRTGRKGYPTYRVIVQEAHRQPTSGKVVANLGSYNPHTKVSTLDKEKAATFLKNGAQPSDRVVKLLQTEKVELPKWVNVPTTDKQKAIRNAEKLRRNQPKDLSTEAPAEAEEVAEEPVAEAPAEEVADTPETEAAPAEQTEAETPKVETPEVEEKPAETESEATEEVAEAPEESDKEKPSEKK